jgi:hypothetical protein
MDIEVCRECEVPIQFSSNHIWLGGGTVVENNDQDHRIVLIECDNLDPLFREVEGLIGIPIERIREPYSIALWCGDLAGSSESITVRDRDVTYEIVAPDVVEMKCWPSPRPVGLTSRLPVKEYNYVAGDIALGKCPSCGGPAALSGYK